MSVLVVGAGPVGLALASELTRLGVSVLAVDKQEQGANTSRACVIHARTLEVLEPLQVGDQLLREAVRVPVFRIRDRDRTLATIDFSDLQTAYPFTLMYPQWQTERLLSAALDRLGGAVLRPVEFAGFEHGQHGLIATLNGHHGVERVACDWLVGCDGMHSTVRQLAGIDFEGSAYPEGFVLADVRMSWPLDREEVTLFFSSQGLMVVAPLPMGCYRIVATDLHAPAEPTLEYVQSLIDARGPSSPRGQVTELIWSSRFKVHHRTATSPRKGRILLCGDAAHVHSPAGGQGMNTGIQDAMSLAPILAQATIDQDVLLEAWVRRRREIAQEVVSMTDRLTRMATLQSPLAKGLRNAAIELLGHVPGFKGSVARKLAELDNR